MQSSASLNTAQTRHTWRRLLVYVGRHRLGWILAAGGILLSTLLLLIVFSLISVLVDDALPRALLAAERQAGLRQIALIALAMAGLTIAGNLLNRQSNAAMARLAQDLVVDLRADLHASLMRQGPTFYREHEAGELLSLSSSDARIVGDFFMDDLASMINYLGQLVMAVAFMLAFHWPLALISVIAVVGVYGLSLRATLPANRRLASSQAQQVGHTNSLLKEDLSGVRDIQIYRQEARATRRFRSDAARLARFSAWARDLSLWNSAMFYMVNGLGLTLIFGLGAWVVVQGGLALGTLISFSSFFQQFVGPLKSLGSAAVDVQTMLVAAQRVLRLVDARPELTEKPGVVDPGPLKGHLRFENASFSYNPADPDAWRLSGLDLEVKPGEKVAIVGGSGTGKSTLLYLAARFQDVTGGRVTIDGHDVRDLPLEAVRRTFALVAQQVVLFSGSLADNIRFARPEADLTLVKAAAEASAVTDFALDLPEGFETPVGETGQGLSGGQRQRVSIARAALADAPVLLLDEATSALDPQTEKSVLQALERVGRGRSVLSVTHRLSTVRDADKIVVLGKDEAGHGVMRAVGQHDELMERSPEYAALVGRASRRRAILYPIGPRYDTTPALPTVAGLAEAFSAPVYVLDFGPVPAGASGQRFGVTIIPGTDVLGLNVAHARRLLGITQTLQSEGIPVEVLRPRSAEQNWVEATVEALEATNASHVVAVENVQIPLEELQASIRQIQRETAVEYILVNPLVGA